MGHPTDKPPPAVTQDLDPVEEGPSSTMAQTGEVEPGDPSSTLLFDDEETGSMKSPRKPRPRPGPSSPTPAVTPPAVKKAATRVTPQLEASSGAVVKPPTYRRNVLAKEDAFETAEPAKPTAAPAKPSFRELWAVSIGGSRVTVIELILAALALLIVAGVAWLFL